MKPIDIPQHHDDPRWILIWPIDELAPVFFAIPLGMFFDQLFLSLIIGFIIARGYKVGKMLRHNGFIQHYLYSKGLMPFSSTKTLNNTFNRRYLPR